jgi:PHD/YefM family antitoxin component YafN of YafNO toxin-antitoxin module
MCTNIENYASKIHHTIKNIKKYLNNVSKSSDVILVSRAAEQEPVVILSLKKYNALNEMGIYYLLQTIEKDFRNRSPK